MDDEEHHVGSLVMPFLPVTSKGGPYEDVPYVAGFEMGRLYVLLEFVKPPYWEGLIRTPNVTQADLICMQFNYQIEHQQGDDDFTFVRIRRSGDTV